ncbi:MAG: hypothetical protein KDC57_15025 [Saprospiraceae bacterium]|nr:hypothetical protein [Saprospiraceae bacterium]
MDAFSVPIFAVSEPNPELITPSGNGEKGLFVLMSAREWPDSQAFLRKILGAIHFDIDKDVRIFPIDDQPFTWNIFQAYQPFNHLWIAGEGLLTVNLEFNPYHWVSIHQKHIIFTHALTQIENNATYKKQLWDALRAMYLE